jgi:hypothetical protein
VCLPFVLIRLFCDREREHEIDFHETVESFMSHGKVLLVRVSEILLTMRPGKGKKFKLKAPASYRGFDLRQKLVPRVSTSFSRIQLAFARFYVDNSECMGELGVCRRSEMRVGLLDHGICRL